jgi:hypothetical protein
LRVHHPSRLVSRGTAVSDDTSSVPAGVDHGAGIGDDCDVGANAAAHREFDARSTYHRDAPY